VLKNEQCDEPRKAFFHSRSTLVSKIEQLAPVSMRAITVIDLTNFEVKIFIGKWGQWIWLENMSGFCYDEVRDMLKSLFRWFFIYRE